MGQPRRRVLHVFCVCSRYSGHEHLRQLAERRERHDRAMPALYQHPTWASHLRVSRWVGTLPLGNTCKVRQGRLDAVIAGLTASAIAQRDGLSIFHERLYCLPRPNYRNHDHRRRLTVLCSVVSVVSYSDYDSTGSYTARVSMFPRCTGHTAGIGIIMAWYGAFRR